MKLDIESKPLSLLEGINTREYSVKIIVNSGFDIGNPSIVWQLLPGS